MNQNRLVLVPSPGPVHGSGSELSGGSVLVWADPSLKVLDVFVGEKIKTRRNLVGRVWTCQNLSSAGSS